MTESLYPDFQLTADNCGEEPIHRPQAIQGRGWMLVFPDDDRGRLRAASEGVGELFGLSDQDLLSREPSEWLTPELAELVRSAGEDRELADSNPVALRLGGSTLDVVRNVHGGSVFVEFEPGPEQPVEPRIVGRFAQSFRACASLEELFTLVVDQLAEFLGFDRVMLYRFDEDDHGYVVAERKSDDQESYLHLHYPATDIPKIARDLFLLNPSRCISDVGAANRSLLYPPGEAKQAQYLDQSYCQLRATSPIHLEYLRNMGVQSTLTVAVVIHNKLWGLFALHHRQPRLVPFAQREACELVSAVFSQRLLELEFEEREARRLQYRDAITKFLEELHVGENYRISMVENTHLLNQLCESDGVALVTLDECVYRSGLAPSAAAVLQVREWLRVEGEDSLFATSNYGAEGPADVQLDRPLGGMLAIRVSEISKSYILWFRQPQTQITYWAGDPSNSVIVEDGEDGEATLRPRKSFAKWREAVEGQSLRWEPEALEMADSLRQAILKREMEITAQIVSQNNAEFMQLAYAASHDLQEPLRTQLNYLSALREDFISDESSEAATYVERASHAAVRMQGLVGDLLSYSQLGVESPREIVDLEEMIKEISRDLSDSLEQVGGELHWENLPTLIGDRIKLRQLFQNLLSNAIKYTQEGVAPRVEVSATQEGNYLRIEVSDNGIGIAPEHHGKIFTLFQRLHRSSEYSGTGIGLAIAKKVVDSMDGKIGVDSDLGSGSRFWILFHRSLTSPKNEA